MQRIPAQARVRDSTATDPSWTVEGTNVIPMDLETRCVERQLGRCRRCESHCAGTCPSGRGAMSGSMSIKCGMMISLAVSQDQMTRTLQACAIGTCRVERAGVERRAESGSCSVALSDSQIAMTAVRWTDFYNTHYLPWSIS